MEVSGIELEALIGGQPEGSLPVDSAEGNHLKHVICRIKEVWRSIAYVVEHDVHVVRDMMIDACRIAWCLQDHDMFGLLKSVLDALNAGFVQTDKSSAFDEKDLAKLKGCLDQLVVANLTPSQKAMILARDLQED